jgi:hypothetical protein
MAGIQRGRARPGSFRNRRSAGGNAMKSMLLAAAVLVSLVGNSRALSWSITTVDGPGDVGAYASIALDPLESPGIAYCASSTDDLKYAHQVGGNWHTEAVDTAGRTGWYTSLAYDASGNPRIAYWDLTNSSLRYARWSGSAWLKETVDNAAYVGQCCSLALDHAGNPSISYYDYTNGDLKFARWDGSAWRIEVVDDGPALLGAGLYTSLALDAQDRPHISYADHTLGQLRYARWDGAHWTIETVDGGTPLGTSIRLDSSGVPHIGYAYQFGQGSHLKYAKRTGPGGTWAVQIARAGGQVGLYGCLQLRPNGEPSILSWDLGHGIVDYDSFENGVWIHDTIETMTFTDQWCALKMDRQAHLHAAYRSATEQDLHYAVAANPAGLTDGFHHHRDVPFASVDPNPAIGDALIRLRLATPSEVRLRFLDVSGREVCPPIECNLPAGAHALPLPGSLGAGVFILRAEVEQGACAVRFARVR